MHTQVGALVHWYRYVGAAAGCGLSYPNPGCCFGVAYATATQACLAWMGTAANVAAE